MNIIEYLKNYRKIVKKLKNNEYIEPLDLYLVDVIRVFGKDESEIYNNENNIGVLCIKLNDYFIDINNPSKRYLNINNGKSVIMREKYNYLVSNNIKEVVYNYERTTDYVLNNDIQKLAYLAINYEKEKISNTNNCKILEFPKKDR